MLQIGTVFPQTEFGHDPVAVRDYAQLLEAEGYKFVDAYDHILGANPERPGGWTGTYTFQSSFLEPFVLYAYIAAFTRNLGLATNIIILPQRQTALVAKQAATLDVISGGRVRLGIGLGWNPVEYVALNENFRNRGKRLEEQVELLRALWTQPLVTFKGKYHEIQDAGLNPLPIQRPIPIWMGGRADEAVQRIARLADGWMTNWRNAQEATPHIELLWRHLEEAGRNKKEFGLEARLPYGDGEADTWNRMIEDWQNLGATHISLNTMGFGFKSADAHMQAVQRFAEAIHHWME